MSGRLSVLQRLRATEVDRAKEEVARLVAECERLSALAQSFRHAAHAESVAAAGDPLAGAMIGAFVQDMNRRARLVDLQRRDVEAQEQRARDALAHAFLEEKKVKLLIEAQETQDRQDRDAAEASQMDEIAIARARFQ